jgi:hypothetical protein
MTDCALNPQQVKKRRIPAGQTRGKVHFRNEIAGEKYGKIINSGSFRPVTTDF